MMRTRTALAALAAVTVAAAFLDGGHDLGARRHTFPRHGHAGNNRVDAAPASLPPGAQAAALEGNPSKPGPFTLRIKIPDGYRLPPHWHPADEHVTVVQGAFVMGIGDKFEQTGGHELRAGAFALMPAGTRHYASAKGRR